MAAVTFRGSACSGAPTACRAAKRAVALDFWRGGGRLRSRRRNDTPAVTAAAGAPRRRR
ncbi:hypothetical protein MAHJHV50_49240 [Mycobacterium avium subsp. hominissuis]